MSALDLSANEIEALVLKAARGGGCPMGLAEDLAAAVAFVDLNALTQCPCATGAAYSIPAAIDAVLAMDTALAVEAEPSLVQGYLASLLCQTYIAIVRSDESGLLQICPPKRGDLALPTPLGRRSITPELLAHLQQMAARTLVPETDASRAAGAGAGSGAGAGLSDND